MDPLLNVILRHQIYLEGLKNGRGVELTKTIGKLDAALRTQLAFVDFDNLSDMSKTGLGKLLVELKKTARGVFDVWLNELIRWLEEYMQVDAEFWRFAYSMFEPEAEPKIEKAKDDASLWAFLAAFPMAANGVLMLSFAKAYTTLAVDKIALTTTQAWANRETPRELTKRLLGTKEANQNDGLIAQFNRQGQAVTNTVMQHVAAMVNAEIASKIWQRYQWCSVIDDATTKICFGRNGKVYVYGQGPLPPAHVGCRSSTIPVYADGPVEMPSFRMWATSQPEAFVKDAFDGNAPSRYEGSKAISLEEFRAKRSLIVS